MVHHNDVYRVGRVPPPRLTTAKAEPSSPVLVWAGDQGLLRSTARYRAAEHRDVRPSAANDCQGARPPRLVSERDSSTNPGARSTTSACSRSRSRHCFGRGLGHPVLALRVRQGLVHEDKRSAFVTSLAAATGTRGSLHRPTSVAVRGFGNPDRPEYSLRHAN